ncbi:MAG: UvrD-helicase domain-containing protein [Thermoanaerobaculia bacterium]
MTPELTDAPQRATIRDAIDRNLLVEAAAGTGKTTSLVDRMVALVGAGTPVERVCAVTFTIKAAAQLDQRFQNALETAARLEKEPTRKARFEGALARLDACFIGTIHAFCSRLLRERPVEAGLDPGFEEMDETEDAAERAESWRRYGERLFTEGSPVLARLLEAGMELEHLREAYDVLCEHGDVVPVSAPLGPPPHFSSVRPRLEAFLDRVMPMVPETVPAAGWDKVQSALRAADRMRRLLDLDATPELVAVLRELDRGRKPDSKSWLNKALAQSISAAMEDFRAEVLDPALRSWREYLHPIAMAAIVPAVEEYAAWRRREARVNFQDQLLFARNLLRDQPAVRLSLRERFTPVLVDEFQDTDPIQAEVLLYLTGSDVEERDWRRLRPVPGSLFVVGDPKQSIYRFRRADIQTYDTVAAILEKSGGEVLRLSTNFRSSAEICAWSNGVFERMFPKAGSESQAAHVPLTAFAGQTAKDLGIYRLVVPSSARHSDMVEPEADRIAGTIAAALEGKPPFGEGGAKPSDFLLLSRRRQNLPCYARALEARGIPYEIAGGGAFRESAEIVALLTAIEAIADPDDPVPLVATLRGPLFGVDDEGLYRFQRDGGRFDFRTSPPGSADARIRRAFGLLRDGADLADALPPAAALSRFLERIGSVAGAAGGSLGDARAGNLLKALAAARELSRDRESFPEIVRRLRGLTSSGEVEEMVTRPGRSDVVRLMTLHRAKGLEARVVFLVDPTDPSSKAPKAWIDRSTDPPRAHILVERNSGSFSKEEIARPLDWDAKQAREKEFLEREDERLLYVAATRAREALVVTFRRNAKAEAGGPWRRFDPHLTRDLPQVGSEAPAPEESGDAREAASALKEFRARRKSRASLSAQPTYAAVSVTALTHAASDPAARPFASATGKGMSWGSALHRLLEGAMRDPSLDLRRYAVNVLAEEERPPEDLEEALAAVEGVRRSPLWSRALASRRCLVEVPFALSVPSSDVRVAEGPGETVLTGAIDLVFEEEAGWILIDYKSDTVAGNRDALVRFYEPQIAHYRRRWRELTGRPTRAGLFFIQTGETAWIADE